MKKIAGIIIAALLCSTAAFAIPAWRGLVKYTQPDGSVITLQRHGDEFCHWTTDASGQLVEKDKDGWWKPVSRERLNTRRMAARAKRSVRRVSPRPSAGVASGQKHFLVILVAFSDVTFQSSTANEDFTRLLNEQGYNANGGTGSARDFYYENSHGYFEPIFDVYGPVQLTSSMSHYGGNDSDGYDLAPEDALIEGCQQLDNQIDFSIYDNDNDGEVDLVFMYYAGYGEADSDYEDSIWPHQWDLSSAEKSLSLDGKKINSYACTNELVGYGALAGMMCGIGAACHEFGHAMGLPDLYDIDYDDYNGEAGGMYDYSLMCSGSYNNEGRTPPYFTLEERILLGWLSEDDFLEFPKSGNYTLTGINNNKAYRTPTDMDGEYFVYECRSGEGWDAYLPQSGLLVYHVDKSNRTVPIYVWNGSSYQKKNITARSLWDEWETYNSINENGSHPCYYVVPAGAQTNLNYTGSKFAFPVSATQNSYTAQSWNGVSSSISLSNISYANNQVNLYASVPSSNIDYTVINNPGNGLYHAGDNFSLSLVEAEAESVSSVSWFFDDEPVSGNSVSLKAGSHTIEAVLTLSTGVVKTVTLELTAE